MIYINKIVVDDINEAPTAVMISSQVIRENIPAGMIVGFLSILISILGIIGGIISSKFIVSDTNEILKNESYSIR